MFETSITPVPSNAEALAKYRAKAINLTPPLEQDNPADGGEETVDMDVKELEQKLAGLKEKLAASEATVEKHQATITAREATIETLTERNVELEGLFSEEKTRANDAEDAAVSKQLDDLIGPKLIPTEKPALVKLAKQDKVLYDEQIKGIEARPDLPHTKGSGLPSDTPKILPKPAIEDGVGGKAFDDIVKRNAFGG